MEESDVNDVSIEQANQPYQPQNSPIQPNNIDEKKNTQPGTDFSELRELHQLADLYEQGRGEFRAEKWAESLQTFQQVLEIKADYQDAKTFVALLEEKVKNPSESDTGFLLFALKILSTNVGYRVQVLNSPLTSRPMASFRIPMSPDQLNDFTASFGPPQTFNTIGSVITPTATDATIKGFGWSLFNSLFTGEIRTTFDDSLKLASEQGKKLRLCLYLDNEPQLLSLPWEYLYHPYYDSFLSIMSNVSIMRAAKTNAPINHLPPLPVALPLPILVLISAPPSEVEGIWSKLRLSLQDLEQNGLIKLELLENADFNTLQHQLENNPYRVVHVCGYGDGIDLTLGDTKGNTLPLDSAELINALRDHPTVKFVVLNMGWGNSTLSNTAQLLFGTTPALRAVMTVPFQPDGVTNALISSVYTHLTEQATLDLALTEARRNLYTEGDDVWWGRVVSYISEDNADGYPFHINVLTHEQRLASILRLAQQAIEQENWSEAARKLDLISETDPDYSITQTLRGKVAKQQNLSELYANANSYVQASDWIRAREILLQIKDIQPNYLDVDAILTTVEQNYQRSQFDKLEADAQAAFSQENWDAAIESLTNLLVVMPDSPKYHEMLDEAKRQKELLALYNKGRGQLDKMQWGEALQTFRELERLDPYYHDLRNLLTVCDEQFRLSQLASLQKQADADFANQNWAAAAAKLQQLLDLNPLDYDSKDKLAKVKQQQELESLYRDGTDYYRNGELDQAYAAFQELKNRQPDYLDVASLLAEVKAQLEQYEKQSRIESFYHAAQLAVQREDWTVAFAALEQIRQINPAQPDLNDRILEVRQQREYADHYAEGLRQYQAGRWHEAMRNFRLVQEVAGSYRDVSTLIATIEDKLEELNDAESEFLDFEMEVTYNEMGYRSRVISSPAGKASISFRLPFNYAELDNFRTNFGMVESLAQANLPDAATIAALGSKLYNAAFGGEVQTCLERSLAEASRQDLKLRIRLRLQDEPILQTLPWEYLYSPAFNQFISLIENVSMVRMPLIKNGLDTPKLRSTAVALPLGILVHLSVPSEWLSGAWNKLQFSLQQQLQSGLVNVIPTNADSFAILQQQIFATNNSILYITGLVPTTPESTPESLWFSNTRGNSSVFNLEQLVEVLKEQPTIKLVIINVNWDNKILADFAEQLTAADSSVRAVLTVPFDNSVTASRLIAEFLNSTAQSVRLDLGLAQARAISYKEGDDVWWGQARLYLNSNSAKGRIFAVEPLSLEQQIMNFYRLVDAAFERKEWSVAIEKLNAILRMDPNQLQAETMLADARRHQSVDSLYASAAALYAKRNWTEAIALLEQLVATNPDFKEASSLLVASKQSYLQEQIASLQRGVQDSIQSGDWDLAVEKLQDLQALAPHLEGLNERLAEAQYQRELQNTYEDAIAAYNDKHWSEAIRLLQQLEMREEGYRNVRTLLNEAQIQAIEAERKAKADALYDRIRQLIDDEDWTRVSEQLEQFQQLDPPRPDQANELSRKARLHREVSPQYQTALDRYYKGDLKGALPYFQQVYNRVPDYRDVENLMNEVQEAVKNSSNTPAPNQDYGKLESPENYITSQLNKGGQPVAVAAAVPRRSYGKDEAITGSFPLVVLPPTNAADSGTPPNQPQPPITNAPPVNVAPSSRFTMPVRIVWLVLVGWWLGLFWTNFSYLFAMLLVTMPESFHLYKWLPSILSLAKQPVPTKSNVPEPPLLFGGQGELPVFVRAFYYVFIGWWVGALWSFVSYLICLPIVTIPTGLSLLNYLPKIMTLQRHSINVNIAPSAPPVATPPVPQLPPSTVPVNPTGSYPVYNTMGFQLPSLSSSSAGNANSSYNSATVNNNAGYSNTPTPNANPAYSSSQSAAPVSPLFVSNPQQTSSQSYMNTQAYAGSSSNTDVPPYLSGASDGGVNNYSTNGNSYGANSGSYNSGSYNSSSYVGSNSTGSSSGSTGSQAVVPYNTGGYTYNTGTETHALAKKEPAPLAKSSPNHEVVVNYSKNAEPETSDPLRVRILVMFCIWVLPILAIIIMIILNITNH